MEARVSQYVRSDLRGFTGYASARTSTQAGTIWLNANEAPQENPAAPTARRYPSPQPPELVQRLAAYYRVLPNQVLVGRGSDEGIDLLIRATCHARQDAILVCPPTFGMYEVSATIHGAATVKVPYAYHHPNALIDWPAVVKAALTNPVKLVFLCSPGNPTGNSLALNHVANVARTLEGKALVVVDEAYQEFARSPSAVSLLAEHENVVVLRTLSKAFGLAGLRVGSVIAAPELVQALRACQAPYPLPELVIEAATNALQQEAWPNVQPVIAERQRMEQELSKLPCVEAVFPSEANFVLVRFANSDQAFAALQQAGIVVRDQRYHPYEFMANALRITIGTKEQNTEVLACLEAL